MASTRLVVVKKKAKAPYLSRRIFFLSDFKSSINSKSSSKDAYNKKY